MPARSPVTDEQIYLALFKTAGAVAKAARLLGISKRTLQRRIKANPHLVLYPAMDSVWDEAWTLRANVAENAELSLFSASGAPYGRYVRDAEWDDYEVELEPTVLSQAEVREFLSKFALADLRRVNTERAARVARERKSGG